MSDITNVNEISVTGVYVDKTNGFIGVNDSAPVNTAHIKTTGTAGATLPILRITDDKASGVNYTAIEIVDDALDHGMTDLTFSTKTAGIIGAQIGTSPIGGLKISAYTDLAYQALSISGVNGGSNSSACIIIEFAKKDATAKTDMAASNIGLTITNNGTAVLTIKGDNSVKLSGAFGCNGATPQVAATIRGDAEDLPTALTLLNQIRAALIADGITVANEA